MAVGKELNCGQTLILFLKEPAQRVTKCGVKSTRPQWAAQFHMFSLCGLQLNIRFINAEITFWRINDKRLTSVNQIIYKKNLSTQTILINSHCEPKQGRHQRSLPSNVCHPFLMPCPLTLLKTNAAAWKDAGFGSIFNSRTHVGNHNLGIANGKWLWLRLEENEANWKRERGRRAVMMINIEISHQL